MARIGKSIEEIILTRKLREDKPSNAQVILSSLQSSKPKKQKRMSDEDSKNIIQSLMDHCQTLTSKVQVIYLFLSLFFNFNFNFI